MPKVMAGRSIYIQDIVVKTAIQDSGAQNSSGNNNTNNTNNTLTTEAPLAITGISVTRPSYNPGQIANGWTIMGRLGGGYGDVYKVQNNKTREYGAMKVEFVRRPSDSVLIKEYKIYKALQKHSLGSRHIAGALSFEKVSSASLTKNFLIMVLLGPSLKELKRKNNGKLESSTILRIGIQSLCGIKMLHDIGYVHRHLKPSCFLMGPPSSMAKSRIIFLADFQLSKRFLKVTKNKVGIYKEEKDPAAVRMRGYIRYVSVSVQNGNEHRCRDDLWSWIYILAELFAKLPWQNVRVDPSMLLALKMTTADSILFSEVNKEVKNYFVSIPEYIRTIHCESRPDYAGIYRKLKNAMTSSGVKFSDPYDWESGEQVDSGFLTDQDYVKYFCHEELIIVRKDDLKGDFEPSAKEESSARASRKVFNIDSDSMELCSFLEPDVTQRSDERTERKTAGTPEKTESDDKGRTIMKKPDLPAGNDSKKSAKANKNLPSSDPSCDKKTERVKTKAPPVSKELESTKKRKRVIPTPPKKVQKKEENTAKADFMKKKMVKKRTRASNNEMTVDKTRECTKEESVDKDDTKSENDCQKDKVDTKHDKKKATKTRNVKSATTNSSKKKPQGSREAAITKKEKKKKTKR